MWPFRRKPKNDDAVYIRDVPRNAKGWPTISPVLMTLPQLIREARQWRYWDSTGTVAHEQWKKYTDELISRGFSTKVQIEERILPDEVPYREKPLWWFQMKE